MSSAIRTFIHSGITGVVNIVYNKGATTVIVLDNAITGMTGHQQNPTTGKTHPTARRRSRSIIEALCHAAGVPQHVRRGRSV